MNVAEKPISKADEKRQDQAQAIEQLRKWLKPGDTVFTILRRCSSSGMTRHISLIATVDGKPFDITWAAARAMNDRMNRDTGGIVTGGCGMDMGFNLVYSLARTLFRDSFFCAGADCPANDHSNAYYGEKNGNCLVCGSTIPATAKSANGKELEAHERKRGLTRKSRGHTYAVCSRACQRKPWKHSDGGYALRHKWL